MGKDFEGGGLTVGSVKASNCGLIGKWWWRFKLKTNTLWVRIMKSIFGENGGLEEMGRHLFSSLYVFFHQYRTKSCHILFLAQLV